MKMEQIFKKFYINRIVGKSSIRIANLKKILAIRYMIMYKKVLERSILLLIGGIGQ
jgi:hypothetical protein